MCKLLILLISVEFPIKNLNETRNTFYEVITYHSLRRKDTERLSDILHEKLPNERTSMRKRKKIRSRLIGEDEITSVDVYLYDEKSAVAGEESWEELETPTSNKILKPKWGEKEIPSRTSSLAEPQASANLKPYEADFFLWHGEELSSEAEELKDFLKKEYSSPLSRSGLSCLSAPISGFLIGSALVYLAYSL